MYYVVHLDDYTILYYSLIILSRKQVKQWKYIFAWCSAVQSTARIVIGIYIFYRYDHWIAQNC